MSRLERLVAQLVLRREVEGRGLVHVLNVQEGVELAQHLLETGQAHWFRGQVVHYPKLTPSLRRPGVDFETARAAARRFGEWVAGTSGLEAVAESEDALLALAQHYGLPTPFIDFTTDPGVAGYFASAATSPTTPGTESCIFCLNTDEADRLWGIRKGTDPERLVIDVSNLWRLEAQHGVFVWCGYDDLNAPFPLDRIVFPYRGPVDTPRDADVYPARESSLETQLREYFQAEKILRGSAVFEEIQRHASWHFVTLEEPIVRPEYFVAPPEHHETWAPSIIAPWLKVDRVRWNEVQTAPTLSFSIDPYGNRDEESWRCEDTILSALQSRPGLRMAPTVVRCEVDQDPETTAGLSQKVQRVWDAMARLPWTDKQVALALSATLRCALEAERVRGSRKDMSRRDIETTTMKRLVLAPLRVELGGQGNIHTWAWLDNLALLKAVRSDFAPILRPDRRHQVIGNSFNTMMIARSPAFLFDFHKLSDLFASDMIPTQAVFYSDYPLFATPARVQIIGPE